MRRALAVMVLALLSLTPTACGGGSKTPVDSGPSARELAASLVEAGDLGTGWTVFTPPEDYGSVGVVTEKSRVMIPRMDFCAKASSASRKAATGLKWEAFTQHHYTTGSDRHLVFLQEFLLSDRESDVRRTFGLLADGSRACAGDRSVSPDGETITQGPLELPALGQERFGARQTVAEPGDNPTMWDVRSVIVRKGTVLIGITIAEIVPPGVQKVLSDAKTTDLMTTIVDKAP
jgi:hypothetical protein